MSSKITKGIFAFFLTVCTMLLSVQLYAQTPSVTSPVNYCKDATASALSATPSVVTSTLRWYTVPTGGTFSTTPFTPSTTTVGTTTYYVSEYNGVSEGPRASISVVVHALPSNPLAVTPVDYCQNATASPLVAFGTSLLWYTTATGGAGSSTAPTPSTTSVGSTTYYVTQSSGTPVCESLREPVVVNVKTTPSAPTVTSPLNYCVGAVAPTLSATGTGLKWYTVPTGGTSSTTAPTPTTGTAGTQTYYVSQTDPTSGCEGPRAAIVVNIIAFPTAGTTVTETSGVANNDAIICAGASVTITGTGGTSYSWSTGATTASITVSPTTTTTYTVTAANGSCTTTTTRTITVNPLPSPVISVTETSGTTADDGNICIGTSANLTASGGTSYNWSTGATTASITVSPAATTTYTVTVTNSNNCSAILTRTITVNPLPTITIAISENSGLFPNDAIVCENTVISLTASGGGTYQWWNAGILFTTSATLTATVPAPGFYVCKAIVTTPAGCVDSFDQGITANARPSASIAVTETSGTTANDGIICTGASANLTASGGGTYAWSTGATSASISVAPTVTTTYTVTVTNPANNCFTTVTQTITVNPLPTGPISVTEVSGVAANDGIICAGASADLSISGGVTYTWSTGATTANILVAPLTTTTYTVTVTNANNCTNTFTRTITVNPLPTPSISVAETSGVANNDAITCSGASVTLTASGGTGYAWSTGALTAATTVAPVSTTTYTVTASSVGCVGTTTQTITVNPLPTISGTLSACAGFSSTLTGSGTPHATTPWTSSNTSVATISTSGVVTAIAAGTTTITYRNNLGCSQTATFTVNAIPTAPTVTSPITLCFSATAAPLTATGSSLLWYTVPSGGTGSTTAITPSTASIGVTTYYVSQTVLGCESPRASIVVNVVSLPASPTVSTPSYTYCQDATSVTTLSATGTSLKWYTVATGGTSSTTAPTPSTTTPGIFNYYVASTSASSPFCESPRSVITVTVNPKPVVATSAATATSFCIGDSVTLNSTVSVFNGFGSTNVLRGNGFSGSLTACDCPNGSVVVGYQGSTGSWVDQFALICKPIDRFGVLGSTTSITSYNGINPGPFPSGAITFSGTDMLVGLRAKTESGTPNNFLGEIAAFGQSQSYITGYGDNTLAPSSLSVIAGWSASTVLGTVYTPNGTVASGMFAYPTFYSSGVSLRYTPIGAYKYNYSWSSAPTTDTNASVVVKTSGAYTLTVTNSLGCSTTTAPINVTVNPLATAPTVTPYISLCQNSVASPLTATKAVATDTLYWYTAASGGVGSLVAPTPSTTTVGETSYYVSAKSVHGCEGARSRIIVYIRPEIQPFEIRTADSILCIGESTKLSVGLGKQDSLQATIVNNNSQNGYMFDIVAKRSTTISAFDVNTDNVTDAPVAIYFKTGTHVGFESSSTGWSLLGVVNITGVENTYTRVPLPVDVTIPTGRTGAFYITHISSPFTYLNYSNGATGVGSVVVEDSNIQVLMGIAKSYPFGSTFTPRRFEGRIHYAKPTVLWSTAAVTDTITVAPTVSTNYWARISNSIGCSRTDTISVQVDPLPVISGVLTACAGATSALTATGTPHPTTPWTSSSTSVATVSSSGLVTAVAAGTTTITYLTVNGCSRSVTFTVNPLPTTTFTLTETSGVAANDGIICVGASATMAATGGTSYAWSTGATTSSITVAPSATTSYTVTITNAFSCSVTRTQTITVNPLPTPTLSVTETSGVAANDAIICVGASATLTAGGGTSYTWSTGATTAAISVSPTVTTTYTATVTNANNCSATITQTITVNPLPTPSTTVAETSGTTANDGIICVGASATITASGGTTYIWSTGATTAAITVSPTVTTTYTATVTNANNCSATITRTITVNPLPTPSTTIAETSGIAANDGITCAGASATITASGGTSYLWSTGATTAAITIAPTVTTTYTVTVTNANGCQASTTRTITVNPLPTPSTTVAETSGTANDDGIICVGATASITAAGGTTYLWSTGATTAGISVSPTSTTTYTVTVTNANNCSATTTRTITVNPLPTIAFSVIENSGLAPNDGNICLGASATITASGGNTYVWSTGATTATIAVAPTTTTTYTVTVTNANNCTSTATRTITVNPNPTVTITSASPYGFVFCKKQHVVITAVSPTATSYAWSYAGVTIPTSTSDTVWANKTGRWGATVTNAFGCRARDSVWVYEDTSVESILSPSTAIICEEGSTLLTCSPGYVTYTFEWLKDGVPMAPPTPKDNHKTVTLPGTYTVYVTNNVGCFDTVQSVVTTYPRPVKPVITYTPPLMEVAKSYRYYQWFRNNKVIIGANSFQYITTVPGFYYVEVTDENGCLNQSDTIEVEQSSSVRTVVSESTIKIYPNPTQHIVYLETPVTINVLVHDLTGRKVFEGKNVSSVNLENYADGTYVFRIYDEWNQLITIQKITKSSDR